MRGKGSSEQAEGSGVKVELRGREGRRLTDVVPSLLLLIKLLNPTTPRSHRQQRSQRPRQREREGGPVGGLWGSRSSSSTRHSPSHRQRSLVLAARVLRLLVATVVVLRRRVWVVVRHACGLGERVEGGRSSSPRQPRLGRPRSGHKRRWVLRAQTSPR